MVKPIDTAARHTYVLKVDRPLPEDQQTVWEFRVPTAIEQAHIDNRTSAWERGGDAGARLVTRDGDAVLWPLKFGLTGVKRFGEVKWVEEPNRIDPAAPMLVTDALLSQIHPAHRQELALEAVRLANLTDADVGNSSLPHTSTTGSNPGSVDGAGGSDRGEDESRQEDVEGPPPPPPLETVTQGL